MGNIVSLATYRCPIGSLAMHKDFGMVEIFEQNGWMRIVAYEHSEPLSLAGEGQEVIYAEEIETRVAQVHVRELIPADLSADVEDLRKRGQLLFNSMD